MIALIVPAYCERAHIADVIRTAPPVIGLIVVIDDASPDDTADVAAATADPRLVVVRLTQNVGAGGAVKIGHQVALEAGAEICVVMDGDGQMDPANLPALLAPVQRGDAGYAKGNRFYSRRSYSGMPLARVAGNLISTVMMKAAAGHVHVRDPLNGYTAIDARLLHELDFGTLGNGFTFLLDMLGQLGERGIPVVDVPMPARYGEEESSLRVSHVGIELLLAPLVVGARRRHLGPRALNRVALAALGMTAALVAFAAFAASKSTGLVALALAGAGASLVAALLARRIGRTLARPPSHASITSSQMEDVLGGFRARCRAMPLSADAD